MHRGPQAGVHVVVIVVVSAELVLHSERVSRHCKGMLQSIADLKQEFMLLLLLLFQLSWCCTVSV